MAPASLAFMQLSGYAFQHARDFLDSALSLTEPDAWAELSLVMSDRTAQRFFASEPSGDADVPIPLAGELTQRARELHPLAALGGPGTGLVGTGPVLGRLHALGLGNAKDLAECLRACGATAERANEVTHLLRNGGVLAWPRSEQERACLAERGQELELELSDEAASAPPPVVAPEALASESRAEYSPVFMPADVTDRNR